MFAAEPTTALDWLALGASVAAVAVAAVAIQFSRKATAVAGRVEDARRVYDSYDVLSQLRVEHWEQAHLLELPINYESTVERLTSALGPMTRARRDGLLLRERAVATRIFTLYEEAWHAHARRAGSRDLRRFWDEVQTYLAEQLMANPRLQYLWREDGGNLRVYIAPGARERYEAHVGARDIAPDSIGPYLHAHSRRALICRARRK